MIKYNVGDILVSKKDKKLLRIITSLYGNNKTMIIILKRKEEFNKYSLKQNAFKIVYYSIYFLKNPNNNIKRKMTISDIAINQYFKRFNINRR